MMDVDDAVRIGIDGLGCEDLQGAGEHDEIYLVLVEQIEHLRFLVGLVLLGDRQVVEGYVVDLGTRGEVREV